MVMTPPGGAGVNRDSMRRQNLATMLGIVHVQKQLTRTGLTTYMQLTRSTIGNLLEELRTLGMVVLVDGPRATGFVGRTSPEVRLVPQGAQAIAVYIGRDSLRAATVGLGGRVLKRMDVATAGLDGPEQFVAAIVALVAKLTAGLPTAAPTVGLGVGLPGMVGDDGCVRLAPSLGWSDVPLQAMLERQLPTSLPVKLSNDGDLGALAEHTRGAAAGSDHMIFVGCDDWGVGAGVISGGHAVRGVGGYAGELGHSIVSPRGRRCQCGRKGCWETEIGPTRVAEALNLENPSLSALATALSELRSPSQRLRKIGRYLGLGLGNAVNALNPELIVLGGTLRDLYPVVKAETDAAMAEVALPPLSSQVRLVLSALGSDAVLVGAAETAMAPLLVDPVGTLGQAHRGPLVKQT